MDCVRGELVRSLAGRDSKRTLVVLSVQDEWLELADGDLRKLASPKRKKRRHVAPTRTVLPESCLAGDKKLREAIAAFDADSPI